MKTLLLAILILNTPVSANLASFKHFVKEHIPKKEQKYKKIKARITFYSRGQDKWGDRNADPNSSRSKVGVTVAAHPDFKFGTEVKIPALKNIVGDGVFRVQDRGGAVTRKTASNKKYYVFDVYVTPKQRRKLAKTLPEYMYVYVPR